MLPLIFLLLGLWMMAGIWEGYHSGKEEDIGNVVLLAMGLMFWIMMCISRLALHW